MTVQNRQKVIEDSFISLYGESPTLWVRAPGRVDLMGSHTDYNEGYVLTLSINRDTWIAARPRRDRLAQVHTMNFEESCEFNLDDILALKEPQWGLYVKGVIHMLQQEGYVFPGFEAMLHGTVPISSGLSSSASLECATGAMLEQLGSLKVDPLVMAKLCQRAENEIAGINCGILDQYSSQMGRKNTAILLDCRYLTHRIANFPEDLGVVICNTCAPRELSGSEYGERRAACENGVSILSKHDANIGFLRDVSLEIFTKYETELSAVITKRCRFIIEENQRVLHMAEALSQNDHEQIRALCVASFEGARDLYEISVPQMEAMMRAMMNVPGIIGGRQAGAGFGGCMVAIVESDLVADFAEYVSREYQKTSDIIPEIYPVRIAEGAGLLIFEETSR